MATLTSSRTKPNSHEVGTSKVVSRRRVTPHDSDESDPDFINGASVVQEPKKKRQRMSAKLSKRTKKLQTSSVTIHGENPLKKWLGSDLDVNSAAEPEDDIIQSSENDEDGDSDFCFNRQPPSSSIVLPGKGQPAEFKKIHAAQNKAGYDDRSDSITGPLLTLSSTETSSTEPESDEESANLKVAHPRLALRRYEGHLPTGDKSFTEPDNNDTTFAHKRKAKYSLDVPSAKKAKLSADTSGNESQTEPESVTEPESEEEIYAHSSHSIDHNEVDPNSPPLAVKQSRHPRPAFKSSSYNSTEPLVLDGSRGIQVTSLINRWLRDYQREGVKFFYDRYKEGRGGILGDDMGLGKTIQVIAFLSAIMKKIGDSRDRHRRHEHVLNLQNFDGWKTYRTLPPANATWPTCLIIAPATVVHNWKREFQTWGYFEVGIYTGSPDEREPVLRDFKLGRFDVLVTSFELALRDIEQLEDKKWSCIFVDEAHRIKNPKSQTTIALNRLTCKVRFGLTGTAIQNNYTELWTILDWSNPGQLGTVSQWNGWVTKPLARGQDIKATDEEIATGRIVAERLVTRLLPNFFKRRTKDIIAEQLPKKIDQVVFCPLTDIQKRVYKQFLETKQVQIMLKKDEECDCGSKKLGRDCHYNAWDKAWLFQYIIILIKISNHLALILPAPIDSPDQTRRHRDQANIGWPPENGEPTAPKYGEAVFNPQLCGKWKVLKDLLMAWKQEGDNKVLVFTKSVKLIEMLEMRLKQEFIEFRKLDGSVKQKDRMTLIDEFNEDPKVFVFLISTLAGGVGLNLTGANKVVIFDPNWNPAHDLQAMDRAYRFGQLRDVSVYRLLGAGSLEELIYKRQIYKQQQMKIGYEASHQTRYFEGVQGDKTKQGDLFGMKNIFRLDESGTNTKHTIERSHLAQLDWALAHLDGKSKRKGVPEEGIAIDEVNERDETAGSVKGLGALFFGIGEESLPQKPEAENDILKILNSNGVSYTHHNESLLKPSNIETRLSSKAIETKRKRVEMVKRKAEGTNADKPEIVWPPKRKHHKTQIPRKAGLSERMDALISLGLINTPADLPKFAEDFVMKPDEEQANILGALDDETERMRDADSPSH